MSEIKVNSIKGVGASTAAITVNNTDGTCTANITNNLSNRNLIINGAMEVAQRGTSSTTSGYASVDRFSTQYLGLDEALTQAQADVAAGTTPYTLGFRKALKITNGNQTTSPASNDYIRVFQAIEAQNIASSGWNYTSSSSNITLSFWIKSSVAQNFYGYLLTQDGTAQMYPYETGSLTADTWTKITKTISGNSNLQFDNDSNQGLYFFIWPFAGTDYTDNSATNNAWATYSGSARMKDATSTWFTTDDATLEITGVQLEVGTVATDFEHRSFAQELALCQRYYQLLAPAAADDIICFGGYMATEWIGVAHLTQEMRIAPTLVVSNFTNAFRIFGNAGSFNPPTLVTDTSINTNRAIYLRAIDSTNVGRAYLRVLAANSGVYATIAVQAEL